MLGNRAHARRVAADRLLKEAQKAQLDQHGRHFDFCQAKSKIK